MNQCVYINIYTCIYLSLISLSHLVKDPDSHEDRYRYRHRYIIPISTQFIQIHSGSALTRRRVWGHSQRLGRVEEGDIQREETEHNPLKCQWSFQDLPYVRDIPTKDCLFMVPPF